MFVQIKSFLGSVRVPLWPLQGGICHQPVCAGDRAAWLRQSRGGEMVESTAGLQVDPGNLGPWDPRCAGGACRVYCMMTALLLLLS